MKHLIMPLMLVALMMQAAAIEIISPAEGDHDTTDISLEITADALQDDISYYLDGTLANVCMNCSGHNETLVLEEGEHTLIAFGMLGNQTENDTVTFSITLPEEENASISIISPEATTYDTTEIELTVEATRVLDMIEYKLDEDDYTIACLDCEAFNDQLTLEEGEHSIMVKGTLEQVITDEVTFSIALGNETGNETDMFTIDILSPEETTYEAEEVHLDVQASLVLNHLILTLDDEEIFSCENCSEHQDTLNLSEGEYTLVAEGTRSEESRQDTVTFEVVFKEEPEEPKEPEENETGDGPRFDTGFNKLPQAVEKGELTDEQLAEIIRDNKINPGIINRLIKSGLLGEASIEAIADTQFNPPGIFKKLLGFFGFSMNTFPDQIAETYELTSKLQEKILTRDDLSRKNENKVKKAVPAPVAVVKEEVIEELPPPMKEKVKETKQIRVEKAEQAKDTPEETGKEDPGLAKGKPDKEKDNPGKGNKK
ncbi:MAG: hypothetical protein ABIH34_03840 [Nanoarchaeota archaeon]